MNQSSSVQGWAAHWTLMSESSSSDSAGNSDRLKAIGAKSKAQKLHAVSQSSQKNNHAGCGT